MSEKTALTLKEKWGTKHNSVSVRKGLQRKLKEQFKSKNVAGNDAMEIKKET